MVDKVKSGILPLLITSGIIGFYIGNNNISIEKAYRFLYQNPIEYREYCQRNFDKFYKKAESCYNDEYCESIEKEIKNRKYEAKKCRTVEYNDEIEKELRKNLRQYYYEGYKKAKIEDFYLDKQISVELNEN